MTVFTLVTQRIIPVRVHNFSVRTREIFLYVNRHGLLSVGLSLAIAAGAAAYLVALMTIFHLGLQMQQTSGEMSRLEQDILKSEIALQQDDANFVSAHKDILDGMEKISSITYVPRERAAAMAPSSYIGQ